MNDSRPLAFPAPLEESAPVAPCVYLASRSPRRSELLRQIGVAHELVATDVDESVLQGESAAVYVVRLALAKAWNGFHALAPSRRRPVLAADTAVVAEGRIFGKPAGREDAVDMLTGLAGRTHQVLTAVALVNGREHSRLNASRVRLAPIAPPALAAYWRTGEPADKAGAYAIQGLGALFIEYLEGSYSGVMGLPLFETGQLLLAAGIDPLPGAPQPGPVS